MTGRTLARDAAATRETAGQPVVRPLAEPLKPAGGLVILRGNLAPDGCVVKVAGHERSHHRGPARVFECEEDAFDAVQNGRIREGDVVVIRYEGPKGGPGMREMLGVTAAIAGAGLGPSACLGAGRLSRFRAAARFTSAALPGPRCVPTETRRSPCLALYVVRSPAAPVCPPSPPRC